MPFQSGFSVLFSEARGTVTSTVRTGGRAANSHASLRASLQQKFGREVDCGFVHCYSLDTAQLQRLDLISFPSYGELETNLITECGSLARTAGRRVYV